MFRRIPIFGAGALFFKRKGREGREGNAKEGIVSRQDAKSAERVRRLFEGFGEEGEEDLSSAHPQNLAVSHCLATG